MRGLDMITYDYYRIFYFVARYKSFTKAAKIIWACSNCIWTVTDWRRRNPSEWWTGEWISIHRCQRKRAETGTTFKTWKISWTISACQTSYFESFNATGNSGIKKWYCGFCCGDNTTWHQKSTGENTSCLLPRNTNRREKIQKACRTYPEAWRYCFSSIY